MSNFTDLTIDIAGNVIYGYAEPTIFYGQNDVLYTGITDFTVINVVDTVSGVGIRNYDNTETYDTTTNNYEGEYSSGINDLIND